MGTTGMQVQQAPADIATIEAHWSDLEPRADPSFFVGVGWVTSWLRLLPRDAVPDLVSVRQDGRLVGAALLGRARVARRKIVYSDSLFLQQCGRPAFDDPLTLEHNMFLADRAVKTEVHRALLAHLVHDVPGWDEFILNGVDQNDPLIALAPQFDLTALVTKRSPSPFVDLNEIRENGGNLLDRLSRNTRYQVRRSMRQYEKIGPLKTRVARDAAEGLQFMEEMKTLHQAYWTRKGKPGSFATPFFERFHRTLVAERIPHREIQLLRVTAGPKTIGYLYNVVKGGTVSSYQSGFWYAEDAKLKPGLVSHALAAQRALDAGAKRYDFLAGDSQYKRSLSNAESELVWLALQKGRLRFRVENKLREAKHRAQPVLRGVAEAVQRRVDAIRGESNSTG